VHAPQQKHDTTATLMLVALGFAWGLTWPAMRISLDEVTRLGDPERLFFNVNAPEDLRIAEAMALR